MRPLRSTWTNLSEEQLLAQCEVDTYRASGPGGQKRNKTSSAVRLRHLPTGLLVIAEESRSQHENKAKALKRLMRTLFLELRDEVPGLVEEFQLLPQWNELQPVEGRISLSPKDPRFWPTAGLALDAIHVTQGQVSTAADLFGVSTANLIDFLQSDPKLWQAANQLRTTFGQKPLRMSK